MTEKQDIFDRIMGFRCFDCIRPFYEKHKEVLLYLFFGGLTFVVSIGSFVLFERMMRMPALIANLFSWIMAVTFAYITNRIWVFTDVAHKVSGVIREVLAFFAGRAATLLLEEAILYIGITLLGADSIAVKTVGQIVVIVSNYFISKIIVFRRR